MSKITDLIDKKLKFLKKCFEYKFFGVINTADALYITTAIYLMPFFVAVSKIASDSLFKNMSSELKMNLLLTVLILGMSTYFVVILKWHFLKKLKKDQKTWFCGTLIIMIWVFSLGAVFINTQFWGNDINLVLRDYADDNSRGDVGGNITCVANDGKYITYGEEVVCDFEPRLYNATYEVIFHLHNGSEIKQMPEHKIVFRPPREISWIEFQLIGYDIENKSHYFMTSNNVNFIAPEEEEIYEDRLINIYLWLVGAMFLIPTMMHNLKKLWDGK